jgi:uncharacterized membrane protein required for colicin V production
LNLLDIIVLAIIGVCVFTGYKRGLLKTVYSLASFFIAIFLTGWLYPYVSRFLRGTPLYGFLKDTAVNSMGLRAFLEEHTARTQSDLINNLPLPSIIRDALAAHNTPDVYEMLNVQTVEGYIGGYFANIALNVISMAAVFILVWFLMRLAGNVLNIIGRLPIISTFNRVGGLAAGLLLGMLIVWIGFAVMNLLLINMSYPEISNLLETSSVARWLYENNWLTSIVTQL